MEKSATKLKPIVWNSPKIKQAYNKKYKKGKLTFFKISNPEGDLDFLLSEKMLKHRKAAAKLLYKAAKKHYKHCRKTLANVGTTHLQNKEISDLERDLVTAKMLKIQAKEYYKLAKGDYLAIRLKG
ncbi:MAG TPA: hypothetical protein ENK85_07565 [Saprospiraceae bacterium]|nr:hypothetical protein [Saprospiraceae bacterium]